jgi:2-octaprenyl-6-methoxyphenol hydroxylase
MTTGTVHPAGFDAVISGAGFTGLALATALTAALGSEVRIALVDRAAPRAAVPPFDSRAFAVSASSKRMLAALGVWDEIAPHAEPVLSIEISDSPLDAGTRPTLLTYDNRLAGEEPGSFIVPDMALTAALLHAVARLGNVAVLAPEEIAGFEASQSGVTTTLASGGKLAARLLVAADGRRSKLRDMAGLKTVGWDYGQTGIVVTIAHERPHYGTAVQHFLPSGPFAMLPLTGNRTCITWSEERSEAGRILALDDASFLAEVEKRFGEKRGKLTLAGKRQSWPLDMVLARSTVAPRLALAGDAAHGVHPIAGQGVNLALRDVAALTEVLADAVRVGLDIGNADALARYERWRRFDGAVSALGFDGLNRLFSSDSSLMRPLRDLGLGIVDRLPEVKSLLVREAAGLTGELPKLLKGERV